MRGFPILTVMSGGRPPLLPRCSTRSEEQASSTTRDDGSSTQGARAAVSDRPPRQFVVQEEITFQVPLVRPKPGLLQILQAAGARGEIFTEREICCHLKDYIKARRMYDPMDPSVVHCHSDPLGQVLGVQRFTVFQVLELLKSAYNRVPDTCIKRKRHLVARAVEGQQPNVSSTTSTTSSASTTSTAFTTSTASTSSTTTAAAGSRTTATSSTSATEQQRPAVPRGDGATAASASALPRPPSISSTTNPSPGPSCTHASLGQAGARGQRSPGQGSSGTSEGHRKARKRHRNKSTSSESADHGGPPVRKRKTSVNLSYETDKEPCDSWCLKVSVEASDSETATGPSQEREVEGGEGGWVVEGDSISLEYESDAFSVEYEVASSSGDATSLSSLSVDVPEEGLLVVCKDSDMEFWADYSDTESDADGEITEEDKWLCDCGHRSLPWQRHCSFCWKLRPDWLPDRSRRSSPHRRKPHHSRYFLSSSDGSDTPVKQLQGTPESGDVPSHSLDHSTTKGGHSLRGDHPVKLSSHCSKQGMPRPTAMYPGAKPLGRPDQDLSSSESSSSGVSLTSVQLEERCRKVLDQNCNPFVESGSPAKPGLPVQRSEVNGERRPVQLSALTAGEGKEEEGGVVRASATSSFSSYPAAKKGVTSAESAPLGKLPALSGKDSSAFEVLLPRMPVQHELITDNSREVLSQKSLSKDPAAVANQLERELQSSFSSSIHSDAGRVVVLGETKVAVPSLPGLPSSVSTSAAAFLEARDEVDGDLSATVGSSRGSSQVASGAVFHIASVMGQGVLNKPSALTSGSVTEIWGLYRSSPRSLSPLSQSKDSLLSSQETIPESASVSGSQSEEKSSSQPEEKSGSQSEKSSSQSEEKSSSQSEEKSTSQCGDREAQGSLQESMSLDFAGDDTDSGVVLSTLSSQESIGVPSLKEDVVPDPTRPLVQESRLNRPLHAKDSQVSAPAPAAAAHRQDGIQSQSGGVVQTFHGHPVAMSNSTQAAGEHCVQRLVRSSPQLSQASSSTQASHSSVPPSPSVTHPSSHGAVPLPSPRLLGAPSTSQGQTQDLCVVCMARPKTGSIVHGSSGHQVCCYKCAKRLKRKGKHCPVCRRPIQKVIRNFIL